jgi:hypothetical protein
MKPRRTILSGMALALFASAASAASIVAVSRDNGSVVIRVTGMIERGDSDAFLHAIRVTADDRKSIERVQLNSTGGNLGEGARLAEIIKQERLATVVGAGAVCASACFLLFAAGEQKYVGANARIGVHKAAEKGGVESKISGQANVLMAGIATGLGVPRQIVARMMSTSPRQIAWLDARDLQLMGVKSGSAPSVDLSPQRAQSAAVPQGTISQSGPSTLHDQSWQAFIETTIGLSAEQNNGAPLLKRSCIADSGECLMGVAFLLKDGRQALAKAAQDSKGNITRREVCESNDSNEARECADWDTGARRLEFKSATGNWEPAASRPIQDPVQSGSSQ